MPSSFLTTLASVVLSQLLWGCSHVTIIGGGQATERHYFGLVVFRANRDAPLTYFQQRAVGLSFGAKSTVAGYLDEAVVQVNDPKACHAVLVVNGAKDREWV